MIIGVDAGCLGISDYRLKTGVFNFGFNLIKYLSLLDKRNKYLLYSFYPIDTNVFSRFGRNAANVVLKPKFGWLNFRLSWEFLFEKPDLFLGLSQALPVYHPLKSIIFVHDLAFEYYPQYYEKSYTRLSKQTKFAVRNGSKIAAVSQTTKNDLVKIYGIDPDKITVIYHGIDQHFFPRNEREITRVKKKYRLSGNYFLFVGSLKPIKNIPRLIQAFAIFLGKIGKPYQLVIVGSTDRPDQEIDKQMKDCNLQDKVRLLGYVPDEDLPGLYSGSLVFVSPSLYEGFGLPIVEAMACGAAVVTSNAGSIPEITGKSAILVDPENIKDLSGALYQVAADKNLRDWLKKEGLRQAKKFSWKKSADQLYKLI